MKQCLFDQWYYQTNTNLNNFTKQIFEAFLIADGNNRHKIKEAWPEWFENLQSF